MVITGSVRGGGSGICREQKIRGGGATGLGDLDLVRPTGDTSDVFSRVASAVRLSEGFAFPLDEVADAPRCGLRRLRVPCIEYI